MRVPRPQPERDAWGMPHGLGTMSDALREADNYHAWLFRLIEPHLGARILDVGGGTGNILPRLLDRGAVTALDVSADCIAFLERRFAGRPGFRAWLGDICDAAVSEALAPEGIDTITCLNVLEHIPDDRRALAHMRRILEARRGTLVLFVPSHPWLYGTMDAAAGHYRRYRRRALLRALAEAGFAVGTTRYVNCVGALGWFVNGRLLRQRELSGPAVSQQIRWYNRVLPLIEGLERLAPPPWGQSLLAVGRVV